MTVVLVAVLDLPVARRHPLVRVVDDRSGLDIHHRRRPGRCVHERRGGTYTNAGGGAYTTGGGATTTGRWTTTGAGRPKKMSWKTVSPRTSWLKTANAPSPSAASVAAPARAGGAAATSVVPLTSTAASNFFMAPSYFFLPCVSERLPIAE